MRRRKRAWKLRKRSAVVVRAAARARVCGERSGWLVGVVVVVACGEDGAMGGRGAAGMVLDGGSAPLGASGGGSSEGRKGHGMLL